MEIEVFAIDGLDAAIIGTTVRHRQEVLCYDYDKCVAIVIAQGYSQEYAEEYIDRLSSADFEGAPAFVYFDNDQEFYGSSPTEGATVH